MLEEMLEVGMDSLETCLFTRSKSCQPPAPAGSRPPNFGFLADPPDKLGTQFQLKNF